MKKYLALVLAILFIIVTGTSAFASSDVCAQPPKKPSISIIGASEWDDDDDDEDDYFGIYPLDGGADQLMDGDAFLVKRGKTMTLCCGVDREYTDVTISWKSSNKRIATVSLRNGGRRCAIKAKKAGTTRITVTIKSDDEIVYRETVPVRVILKYPSGY